MNTEDLLRQLGNSVTATTTKDLRPAVRQRARQLARRRLAAQSGAAAGVLAVSGGIAVLATRDTTSTVSQLQSAPAPASAAASPAPLLTFAPTSPVEAAVRSGFPTSLNSLAADPPSFAPLPSAAVTQVPAPPAAPAGSTPGTVYPSDADLAAATYFYGDFIAEQAGFSVEPGDPQPHDRVNEQRWTPRDGIAHDFKDGVENKQANPPPTFSFLDGKNLSWDQIAALTTDPAKLKALLYKDSDLPLTTTDPVKLGEVANTVYDFVLSNPVPSAQREALETQLAALPGMVDEGLVTDDLGRTAHSYYLPGAGQRYFYSADGAVLEYQSYDALGQLIDETTMTAAGIVDSKTATLPDAGSPAAIADPKVTPVFIR